MIRREKIETALHNDLTGAAFHKFLRLLGHKPHAFSRLPYDKVSRLAHERIWVQAQLRVTNQFDNVVNMRTE